MQHLYETCVIASAVPVFIFIAITSSKNPFLSIRSEKLFGHVLNELLSNCIFFILYFQIWHICMQHMVANSFLQSVLCACLHYLDHDLDNSNNSLVNTPWIWCPFAPHSAENWCNLNTTCAFSLFHSCLRCCWDQTQDLLWISGLEQKPHCKQMTSRD